MSAQISQLLGNGRSAALACALGAVMVAGAGLGLGPARWSLDAARAERDRLMQQTQEWSQERLWQEPQPLPDSAAWQQRFDALAGRLPTNEQTPEAISRLASALDRPGAWGLAVEPGDLDPVAGNTILRSPQRQRALEVARRPHTLHLYAEYQALREILAQLESGELDASIDALEIRRAGEDLEVGLEITLLSQVDQAGAAVSPLGGDKP